MPRKSNKTEQVLRLITKSGDHEDPAREETEAEVEAEAEAGVFEETGVPEEPVAFEEPEAPAAAETDIYQETESRAEPVASSVLFDEEEKERLKAELREELKREFTAEIREQAAAPAPAPAPVREPEPEPSFDAPAPTHSRELTAEGPALQHKETPPVERDTDVQIVNLSELLASELMTDVMRKLNVCDCKLCKADVLALTLNHLPQKYVTTDAGKQYMQLNMYRKQYETDVLSALTRACVRVKGSPRHS